MSIMIDLETLSTRANALILTIGAIKFDTRKELKKLKDMDTFYRRITIESGIQIGCHKDPITVQWWNEQDPESKLEAFSPNNRVTIQDALKDLSKWFGNSKFTKVWAHGPQFDITILDEAYKNCGLDPPWKFWNIRCTRTVYCMGGVKMIDLPSNNKHHSLWDSYRQIIGLYRSYKNMHLIK
jgi:DNA polymerase III epsilon subunit-like protein